MTKDLIYQHKAPDVILSSSGRENPPKLAAGQRMLYVTAYSDAVKERPEICAMFLMT